MTASSAKYLSPMSYPNPLPRLALVVSCLAAAPLLARPPIPTATFQVSVTPDSDLLHWGIGIVREDGGGGYNVSFQAGFPDLEGQLTVVGRSEIMVYPTHSGPVTMALPFGVGDFGYFILGRYQAEIPDGEEAGVSIGMLPATATSWTTAPSKVWDVGLGAGSAFPDISENEVYYDLVTPADWPTTGTGSNSSFLAQLFAISAKTSIALGTEGGPTQLNLTLVTFSEAFTGGSVVLSTNPVPEASTWAAAVAAVGAGLIAWRRSRRPASL